MTDKIKKRRILDGLLFGIQTDPPADKMLRYAFWSLTGELNLAPTEWTAMMTAYCANPKYGNDAKAKRKDRAVRITTALTGGGSPSKQPEFTWKRFIEGLVVLDVDTLTVCAKTKRGRWGTEKLIKMSTSPKEDRARVAYGKEEEFLRGSATTRLNDTFTDIPKAKRVMSHILLKLLWSFMEEYQIDKNMWGTAMHRYVNDDNNCAQLHHRRNDKKNNLQQLITQRANLTWNRFIETLKVIDVRELEITFGITRGDRPVIETTCVIDITKLSFKSGDEDE